MEDAFIAVADRLQAGIGRARLGWFLARILISGEPIGLTWRLKEMKISRSGEHCSNNIARDALLAKGWDMKRQVAAAIFSLILSSASSEAATVLSDGNFVLSPTQWTSTQIFGTGSQTITTGAAGGNLGAYLNVKTDSGAAVINNHLNSSLGYDPAFGAITSIDFSIDYLNFFAFGQGMGVRFIAEQDGTAFQSSNFFITENVTTAPWRTFVENGLTSSSFLSLGIASAVLDFSTTGSVIKFGFQTFNQSGGGITVGYDNFSATINTAAVPIPAALPLMASALVGMGFIGWRRKRSTA